MPRNRTSCLKVSPVEALGPPPAAAEVLARLARSPDPLVAEWARELIASSRENGAGQPTTPPRRRTKPGPWRPPRKPR